MALSAYLGLLLLVAAERGAELLLSRRNARLAFARGGVETGAAHFRWMALLHALFLPACAVEAALRAQADPPAGGRLLSSPLLYPALAFALCAQALRWWAILSLGARWNVRVIVVPGEAPVRRGPYLFLRHPNYLAVVVELLCLPLAAGAWLTALVFSLLDAWVLRIRIRDEERALGAPWAQAFARVPRFIPHG